MSEIRSLNSLESSVLLLGGAGYVGQAFQRALNQRGFDYFAPSSSQLNILQKQSLQMLVEGIKPKFVINCAGYTGKPNVDACEVNQDECRDSNVIGPLHILKVCDELGVPWGHVSSGCIYNGYDKEYTEEDEPNFSFDNLPCSYYSGTKAEAEKIINSSDYKCYTWRLRIPFNTQSGDRNYLTKLQKYTTLLNLKNSMSHLDEYARACLSLWELEAPYGIYNVVNNGSLTAEETINIIRKHLKIEHEVKFMDDVEAFYDEVGAKTPRSNCVLSNQKLKDVDVPMRDVDEAIEHALQNWQTS